MSAKLSRQTLAVILAGGVGSRLGVLTRDRSKPALPFGGRYRSVDFTLSNCINSGVRRIGIATQYQARSLIRHIQQNWSFLHHEHGDFIELWPAEQRHDAHWYEGTADAVYRNFDAIERHAPRYVLVLGADHVYRMDYANLLQTHRDNGADLTIACQPISAEQACNFGIMSVDGNEIRRFQEKPLGLKPGGEVLASMGVYVFDTDLLGSLLCEDACCDESRHDFGRDLIPTCVHRPGLRVCAHSFRDPCTGGPGYWRDIGTIDAYWAANMELLAPEQGLDLHDPRWPILSAPDFSPPTRVTGDPEEAPNVISRSMIAGGCRIDGAIVRKSILFSGVTVGAGSLIEESLLLPGARIGASCQIRRAIIDEGVNIADGMMLGKSPMVGRHYCETSPAGVTILASRENNVRMGKELPRTKQAIAQKTSFVGQLVGAAQ